MNSGEDTFPSWLVTVLVLALAIAFIAVDPVGLASAFWGLELNGFRALDPLAAIRGADSVAAQILLLETAGAALALLVAARQLVWAVAVAIVVALLAQFASLLIYAHLHVAFDLLNAGAGLVVAGLAGAIARATKPEPKRRLPETRAAPLREPAATMPGEALTAPLLGAETMTSLALDTLRLSALAQSFGSDGAGLVRLVETAMGGLVDNATQNGAALSRFDGASFAAHWRAGQTPAHADRACDSAARMIETIGKINATLAEKWPHRDTPCPQIEIGIGIASGPVLAGRIRAQGSQTTLVVPAREPLPERLAALAPHYGVAALVSEETRAAAARDHAFLEVDFRVLDASTEPMRIYALHGNALLRASPKFRALSTFHDRIFEAIAAREWNKARSLIEQCRNLSGASGRVYDIHLARLDWYQSNPPPDGWDGAFHPPAFG